MQAVAWPILCLVAVVAYPAALGWRSYIHTRQLKLRVQKLYASQLFEDILPFLKIAKKHMVEQVTVDKTGVMIRLLYPVGNEMAFLMRANGYPYLTPDQQEALRAVLEECVPKLADHDRYFLSRRRDKLINGEVEYRHSYVIQNAYKTKLVRAPYYDGSLQTRSW